MTRDEAVTLVKNRLSRSTDTTLDASIVLEMRYVQEQILEKLPNLPWFLISDEIAMATVVGNPAVAVPTNVGSVTGRDFLREVEGETIQIQEPTDSTWSGIGKDNLGAIRTAYGDTPGKPKKYALVNTNFLLYPISDVIYSLKTRVYLREPRLTTNIENGWLLWAADLVIAETRFIIASDYLHDIDLAAKAEKAANIARAQLFVTNEAREHAAQNYSMGGDDN
jgi:hypothetical protein